MYLFAIAGILLIASLIVAFFFYRQVRYQMRYLQQIQSAQEETLSEVEKLNEKFTVIRSHATDYINSLGPELAHEIFHIQNLLLAANAVLEEVQQLATSEELSALAQAHSLIETHFACKNSESPNDYRAKSAALNCPSTEQEHSAQTSTEGFVSTTSYREELAPGWQEYVESQLKVIGEAINAASLSASATGLPKRRERKSTQISLKELGLLRIEPKEPSSE